MGLVGRGEVKCDGEGHADAQVRAGDLADAGSLDDEEGLGLGAGDGPSRRGGHADERVGAVRVDGRVPRHGEERLPEHAAVRVHREGLRGAGGQLQVRGP